MRGQRTRLYTRESRGYPVSGDNLDEKENTESSVSDGDGRVSTCVDNGWEIDGRCLNFELMPEPIKAGFIPNHHHRRSAPEQMALPPISPKYSSFFYTIG